MQTLINKHNGLAVSVFALINQAFLISEYSNVREKLLKCS